MTTVALAPTFGVGYQAFDTGGLPLNAGLIYTYIAGGTTPADTFTTPLANVANANPIVLAADGRPPSEIWLDTTRAYRFDLKTSTGTLIKSYDNISANVTLSTSFAAFGAVGDSDGTQGDGTDDTAAIQAALDFGTANGVTIYGTDSGLGRYRITAPLLIDANLSLVMDPACIIFPDFVASANSGWMAQRNYTAAVKINNVTIIGGQFIGRTDWSSEGAVLIIGCDNLTWRDTRCQYYGKNGSMHTVVGDNVTIENIVGTNPYTVASGATAGGRGGIRYLGGDNLLVSNCYIESDDDTYQLNPAAPGGGYSDLSITRARFVACRGKSYAARFLVVQLIGGASDMTASITDWAFIGCSGSATVNTGKTAAGMNVVNEDSTGDISNGSFVSCTLDASTASSTRAVDIRNQFTGNVKDISFTDFTVISPFNRAIEIRVNGGAVLPRNIRFDGFDLGASRTAGESTIAIREGREISFAQGSVKTNATATAISVGTGAVDCPGVFFNNVSILDIPDGEYGISWTRCTIGGSQGCEYAPLSGSTTAAGAIVRANSSNISILSDDFSQLPSAAASRINNGGGATNVFVRGCKGFVTRNSGTSSIANGATQSADIAHGLNVTPAAGQITVTQSGGTTNDVVSQYINTIGATNFRWNCGADPGATGLPFGWKADAEKIS